MKSEMEANVHFRELYPLLSEELRNGNTISFTANGTSMLPFLRGGVDKVTLAPLEEEAKKNDVVFYLRKNGTFVLHRIVKVMPNGMFILCGDNQYSLEKGVRRSDILAKLIYFQHKGKTVRSGGVKERIFCFFLPCRRFLLHVKSFLSSRIKKSR